VNILPDDRSPETDDGSVNPHNEAMAQKPVADPLDRVGDNNERLRNPKTDADRKDALKEWGRKARQRGGSIMSADWQEFQELTGERERAPSQEDIQAAEKKQREAAEKQQAASARTSAKGE
jgi:hypothetical protein